MPSRDSKLCRCDVGYLLDDSLNSCSLCNKGFACLNEGLDTTTVPTSPAGSRTFRCFVRILQIRGWIVAAFVVLTLAGIYGTTRVPNDPAIDRLVVSGDPIDNVEDWEREHAPKH